MKGKGIIMMMTRNIILIVCGIVALVSILIAIGAFIMLKDIKIKHEAFEFNNNEEVVVIADIPTTYKIADIEIVEFSIQGGYGSYYGRFRVIKNNGKKSRNYMYGKDVYTKDFSFNGSQEEMAKATEYLMQQLQEKDIPCELK